MSLEIIDSKVNEELGRRADEVFGLFFIKLKEQHIKQAGKKTCECQYCKALGTYVRTKISFGRVKKLLDDDCSDINQYNDTVEVYSKEIKRTRRIKNEAKKY